MGFNSICVLWGLRKTNSINQTDLFRLEQILQELIHHSFSLLLSGSFFPTKENTFQHLLTQFTIIFIIDFHTFAYIAIPFNSNNSISVHRLLFQELHWLKKYEHFNSKASLKTAVTDFIEAKFRNETNFDDAHFLNSPLLQKISSNRNKPLNKCATLESSSLNLLTQTKRKKALNRFCFLFNKNIF